MNRSRFAYALLLCHCGVCFGQQASQAFASVDAAFQKARLQWTQASAPFQAVRRDMGPDFEPELWRYLGNDVDKQDRIASFLVYPGYLHGSLPMPNLARQINLKTLSLLAGKPDRSSRILFVTASVDAAVESGELEYTAEAERHKMDVQKMLAAERFLVAGLPAMTDYENCVYDLIGNPKIPSPASTCLPNKTPDDPRITTVDMGQIEGDRVISRPEPRWPPGTKSGLPTSTIMVRILIDETGKAEAAEAWSGSSALREAAVAAARKAHFQKVIYQGHPVKVWGWLAYAY
jgi:hypothetical protein